MGGVERRVSYAVPAPSGAVTDALLLRLTGADSAYTGISSPTVRRHDLVDGRRRGVTTLSSPTTTPTNRHHDLVDARRRGAAVSSPAERPIGLL